MEKVQVSVKALDGTPNIIVEAFVSDICYPFEYQEIDVAKSCYGHLRNIQMADGNPENAPLQIDMLIGASNYWDFMTGEMRKGQSGPVALGSKLGYILSGTVNKQADNLHSANVCVSYIFQVESKIMELKEVDRKNLLSLYGNEELHNNIKDIAVLEKFEGTACINDEKRY